LFIVLAVVEHRLHESDRCGTKRRAGGSPAAPSGCGFSGVSPAGRGSGRRAQRRTPSLWISVFTFGGGGFALGPLAIIGVVHLWGLGAATMR
jgi:hypothetical protein